MRHFITANSGKRVNLKNPKPESIDINDIAIALSRVARFTGHTKEFISVGQHSINVKWLLQERGEPIIVQLYGLLHDASEAYLNDIVRPIKQLFPIYYQLEHRIMKVILKGLQLNRVLCLTKEQHKTVKLADDLLAVAERRDQINHGGTPCPRDFVGSGLTKGWERKIKGMEPNDAARIFLEEYYNLVVQL